MCNNDLTLAGVAGLSVSNGKLGDDSQPIIRVPKARTSLKPCSPAKGVEHNGVRTLRYGDFVSVSSITNALANLLRATGTQRQANRAALKRALGAK